MSESESYYQLARRRGVSRRDFLKFCALTGAMLGLDAAEFPKIVQALQTKPRLPVIYLNLQECTCCTESFLRSAHPLISDLILNMISLDYMEPLQAAAGKQAEAARLKTMKDHPGAYLLVVEGSATLGNGGVYCTIGGQSSTELLKEVASGAAAVIAYGSCATNACVQGAYPNPTQAVPIRKVVKNKPIIDVPGCPPIAEVITGTIVHYLTYGEIPELTNLGRPKAFYQHRVHDNCVRRAFFDAGQFVESFDDAGAKQGWCLYKVGCKGPTTYNACAITEWNDGVSYPIKSGHPCIGCSEDNYFDNTPLYTRLAKIPNNAIGKDADTIGAGVLGLTGIAVAAHAGMTAVVKNHEKSGKESKHDKNRN
ncbi:hydrogenase small subunit [Desulfosporosinus sp. BG]|uniref:hydrogenase small subunit n=1 Tax=Desulfosporosinus sp. BG TaxID=1633135 RepID=UPI00083A9210|nr:hydrogenase small subunit [Desulfosporosinus sp. BG]ODA40974.1 [NiFe] hydrogenase, group 1, small subunit [Desulfosporosinus sp. BG]